MADLIAGIYKLYQVAGGTWTLKARSLDGVGSAGTFTLHCKARRGSVRDLPSMTDTNVTVPAGGVGVWAGSAIEDDAGDSNLWQLSVKVDGANKLTTTTLYDTWLGGHVGLFRATGSTTTTIQWDEFICGIDLDEDGTLGSVASPDVGDSIYAAYDFDDPPSNPWEEISRTHDKNGNLTADGRFQYTYDAWNRLACISRADHAAGSGADAPDFRIAILGSDPTTCIARASLRRCGGLPADPQAAARVGVGHVGDVDVDAAWATVFHPRRSRTSHQTYTPRIP